MAIWHKGRGSGGGFTAQSGKQTKFHPVVPQGTHSSNLISFHIKLTYHK